MANFNEKTDVYVNLLVDHLLLIYRPIHDKLSAEYPTWYGDEIGSEAIRLLNEHENFTLMKIEDESPVWVVRFPTEQHKLQYLLKHT
jgi:hypothetical protein